MKVPAGKKNIEFQILTDILLENFKKSVVSISPKHLLKSREDTQLPVDYFQFYHSVSSVYSSKIEGENIDFDSYFKHKFMHVPFKPNYTQRADDLFSTYEFINANELNLTNLKKAHAILSNNLLPEKEQGKVRNNLMFVINNNDKIEYVAVPPKIVENELQKLFIDIQSLLNKELDEHEIFYFAALIHLIFVKIHPFQDGNGRTARLIEKWFLLEKLGKNANSIQLEKNYFQKLTAYYENIQKIGIEYETLDFQKSLDFLLMTITGLE